ncbi:hypothetical protein ACWGNM_34210 [Streptomyces sp. NPDC055796]
MEPVRPEYCTPSPELRARAERGLARFLDQLDEEQESATDWGKA